MAPLFAADLLTLQAQLRLTAAAQQDSGAIIARAVSRVRVQLFSRLGASRIATINATAISAAPATDAEILRTRAANVEVSMVRLLLLQEMPTFVMDAAVTTSEAWNQEGLTRGLDSKTRTAMIEALIAEIESELAVLDGTTTEVVSGQASIIGPASKPAPLGSDVFGCRSNTGSCLTEVL